MESGRKYYSSNSKWFDHGRSVSLSSDGSILAIGAPGPNEMDLQEHKYFLIVVLIGIKWVLISYLKMMVMSQELVFHLTL